MITDFQNFKELHEKLEGLPVGEKPDFLFFLYFKAEPNRVVGGEQTAGAIECIAAGHSPLTPGFDLYDYQKAQGSEHDWNLVCVWGVKDAPDAAGAQRIIDEKVSEIAARTVAQGLPAVNSEAFFDPSQKRVVSIDFIPGKP